MPRVGRAVFAVCVCQVPRRSMHNSLCTSCGNVVLAETHAAAPNVLEFRNDHGSFCCCLSCVMRRTRGTAD
jgi:hypothetical protein